MQSSIEGMRILVVDDSSSLRATLVEALHDRGAVVDEADNGVIGMSRITGNAYDLVFTDLVMPEMDGFEFCREVRKLTEGRTVPIIAVSTYTDSHYITRVLREGADDFTAKPFNFEQLDKVIERVQARIGEGK